MNVYFPRGVNLLGHKLFKYISVVLAYANISLETVGIVFLDGTEKLSIKNKIVAVLFSNFCSFNNFVSLFHRSAAIRF